MPESNRFEEVVTLIVKHRVKAGFEVPYEAWLRHIVGVAGQNAANARIGQERKLDRTTFLDALATQWSQLDADAFPFARSAAAQLRTHDDRDDFLAGIDLILDGIATQRSR